MSFEELVLSDIVTLPIQPNLKGFKYTITNKLKSFLKAVESLDQDDFNIPGIGVNSDFVKGVQRRFIDGLLHVVDDYYNGYPEKAYASLHSTLVGDEKDFKEILKIGSYDIGEDFYRIRNKKENFPFTPVDMFHIPFESRGKVSTQRYSIPGFPSLYLGKSLFVCWEELSRPNIDDFQVVRLEGLKEIKYIDLVRPDLSGDLNTQEIYRYIMTWPLIACCSVKVQNPNDIFKPEYIIPQLLLQWIRCNGEYDAIRYNSTHLLIDIETDMYNINVVLPVKENRENGHCKKLKKTFSITNPISYQLKEIVLGSQNFSYVFGELENTNKIELIKGRKYPYGYSIFGDLERFLKGMPANKF